MSAHLLNELGKSDKMYGLNVTLKMIKNRIFGVKTSIRGVFKKYADRCCHSRRF